MGSLAQRRRRQSAVSDRVFLPHWTPRYALARSRLAIYQRRHADAPWLTADAVRFLDSWIRSTDHCLEWGAGRSTSWLATRAERVTSVEHDAVWARRVRHDTVHLPRTDVHLVDAGDPDRYAAAPDGVVDVDMGGGSSVPSVPELPVSSVSVA